MEKTRLLGRARVAGVAGCADGPVVKPDEGRRDPRGHNFVRFSRDACAMSRRRTSYRWRRFRRQLIGIVLTTAAAITAVSYAPEAMGSLIRPLAGSEPSRSSPRILRGGEAWNGTGRTPTTRTRPAPSAAPPAAQGAQLIDVVTRVRDGDTIVVGLIQIRIANLDCAETGTADGERATRRMSELVRNQQLTCQLEGRRSWDREVGVCALPSGRDIGEILIEERLCARWQW